MDEATLAALRGSIAKWEAIVDGTGVDKGSDNCPLCHLFIDMASIDDECEKCPVMLETGLYSCKGTPYVTQWLQVGDFDISAKTPQQKAAAQAELDFLKSLLPAEMEK